MVKKKTEAGWSQEEFEGVELGDRRLNERVKRLAEDFASQPLASINQASEDWADTKAAYRFFDNEQVRAEEILKAHRKRVEGRMRGHEVVLAIQDTTELDYSAHRKTSGLGPIGNYREGVAGIMMHTTLAMTVQGVALGVLAQQMWVRDEVRRQEEYEHKRRPIIEKESYKWLEALETTMKRVPQGVQVITVGDREADLYEFLLTAEQLQAGYVVRAVQDRRLVGQQACLWEELHEQAVAGLMAVEVASRAGQPARTARLEVRYAQVTVRPPQRPVELRMAGWKAVEVWAVWATEINPPAGATPLEWMLLTNVPVMSFQNAVERIEWYCLRWQIEIFHKILKSGCRVEACRLMTAERLMRYLALMCVVAWRLFWLTHINRQQPEAPCTTILAEHEWQALYCRVQKTTQLPPQPPTVQQAVRWIAKLGGFLGRKGDGEPGVTTIWRGWQRLTDIAETWFILHPPKLVGNS